MWSLCVGLDSDGRYFFRLCREFLYYYYSVTMISNLQYCIIYFRALFSPQGKKSLFQSAVSAARKKRRGRKWSQYSCSLFLASVVVVAPAAHSSLESADLGAIEKRSSTDSQASCYYCILLPKSSNYFIPPSPAGNKIEASSTKLSWHGMYQICDTNIQNPKWIG